ncbi:MAG: TIGR03936 family radical SAM-associated protein [Actinomycetes bacterium]
MRIRFRFSKKGKVRFTSHRDVARMWERALRRGELPVALTEGFSPRPKMHFGLALSTAHESWGEYIDVDFRDPEAQSLDLQKLPSTLTPLLPDGIAVESVAVIETSDMSLQEAVTSCSWTLEAIGLELADASSAVEGLLAAEEVFITRNRKGNEVTDDIRPCVLQLAVLGPVAAVTNPSGDSIITPAGTLLEAELATKPRGLRPSELLGALEPPAVEGRVCRTHQWITLDGARHEPLPAAALSATHSTTRAS